MKLYLKLPPFSLSVKIAGVITIFITELSLKVIQFKGLIAAGNRILN